MFYYINVLPPGGSKIRIYAAQIGSCSFNIKPDKKASVCFFKLKQELKYTYLYLVITNFLMTNQKQFWLRLQKYKHLTKHKLKL